MSHPTRREMIAGAALGGLALTANRAAAHQGDATNDPYQYEVTRTEAEWRERLTDVEYTILREGGTEPRFSSEYAAGHTDGHFHCKGCDLVLYEGRMKEILPIGWVFFHHSVPDALLMSQDAGPTNSTDVGMLSRDQIFIEVHCRRCGSHMGHMVNIDGEILHCINGQALVHSSAAA